MIENSPTCNKASIVFGFGLTKGSGMSMVALVFVRSIHRGLHQHPGIGECPSVLRRKN